MPANADGVFHTLLPKLTTFGEPHKALERLAGPQASVQELKVEVTRFNVANSVATALQEVVTGLESALIDEWVKRERKLAPCRTRYESARDMIHAAARERTRVKVSLDEEWQKVQRV